MSQFATRVITNLALWIVLVFFTIFTTPFFADFMTSAIVLSGEISGHALSYAGRGMSFRLFSIFYVFGMLVLGVAGTYSLSDRLRS